MLVSPGYEPVRAALDALVEADPTFSAQLAAYVGGELVLDLTVGPGLAEDALLPVYSSSKGASGIVIALLVERGQLDLDATVASYWPEFAAAGKAAITVRQLLSHQAGLHGVEGRFTIAEALEHTPLAARLAAQRPAWAPGQAHGYHAITIGTLADELVRRTTGRTLAAVFTEDVASPRGVDVHLGLPEELDPRVCSTDMPTAEELGQWAEVLPAPNLGGYAPDAEPSDASVFTMVNEPAFRRYGLPGAGGLASARGLARMYASLRHDLGAPRLLSDDVIAQVSQLQVTGQDLITGRESRFGVLFELPTPFLHFGSARAFGHGGLGGSVAFCDPAHELAFGFIPKRLPAPSGAAAMVGLLQVLRAVSA